MAISAEHGKLSQADRITEPTDITAIQRLVDEGAVYVPQVLTVPQFATLNALLHQLLHQPEETSCYLAAGLDRALSNRGGDSGAVSATVCSIGLDELDSLSRTRAGYSFAELTPEIQDAILELVAAGDLASTRLDLARWLDELCSTAHSTSLTAN